MRHFVRGRKLGRTSSHRKATLQALSVAIIREHRIQTTVAKAKELRRFIEPLITKAKSDTMHNRRMVFASLQDKNAVRALFEEIAPKVGDREGGYTRVLKTGFRSGDASELALIELVDFNPFEQESAGGAKKKRTRRSGKAKAEETEASPKAAAPAAGKTQPEESTSEQEPVNEAPAESAEVTAEAPAAEEAAEAKPDAAAEEQTQASASDAEVDEEKQEKKD